MLIVAGTQSLQVVKLILSDSDPYLVDTQRIGAVYAEESPYLTTYRTALSGRVNATVALVDLTKSNALAYHSKSFGTALKCSCLRGRLLIAKVVHRVSLYIDCAKKYNPG